MYKYMRCMSHIYIYICLHVDPASDVNCTCISHVRAWLWEVKDKNTLQCVGALVTHLSLRQICMSVQSGMPASSRTFRTSLYTRDKSQVTLSHVTCKKPDYSDDKMLMSHVTTPNTKQRLQGVTNPSFAFVHISSKIAAVNSVLNGLHVGLAKWADYIM